MSFDRLPGLAWPSVTTPAGNLLSLPFETAQLHQAMQQALIDADHEFIVPVARR